MPHAFSNPPQPRFRVPPRAWLAVLCVLLLTSGCAYFNTFYHAKKYYGEAEKTRQAEERQGSRGASAASPIYKKSIEKCEKIIKDYPGSKWQDDAYLLLTKAQYHRGDFLAAGQAVGTLLTSFPESDFRAEGIHWQGRIQFAKEEYNLAQATWTGLLEEFPKFDDREEVEYFLAQATWLNGNNEQAIEAYTAFLKRYSKGEYAAGARLDLGALLVDEKRYPEAEQVFTTVIERGKTDWDRTEGKLRLGEVLELEGRTEDALELYSRLEVDLAPEITKGRMSQEERAELETAQRAAREAARADSLRRLQAEAEAAQEGQDTIFPGDIEAPNTLDAQGGINDPTLAAAGLSAGFNQQFRRDANDPRQKQLAQAMLREGAMLAKLSRPEDALLVYEQVIREFPQSPFAAEAQYRLGYTYEVHLEQFDQAQAAYDGVARQGDSSFREDAVRRSKNLVTLRGLMSTAAKDSLSQATAAQAEARFMRAELYLFQQENSEKAVEEYRGIETDFAGSEHAAKAGLALAWITENTLGDSLGAMAKYTEVAQKYPDTEFGRRASVVVFGPEPEPDPIDFAGPSVGELTAPENLAIAQAQLLEEEAADSAKGTGPAPLDLPPGDLAGTGPPSEVAVAGAAAATGASLGEIVEASRRQTGELPSGPAGAGSPSATSTSPGTLDPAPPDGGVPAEVVAGGVVAGVGVVAAATDPGREAAGAASTTPDGSLSTGDTTPLTADPDPTAVGASPSAADVSPSAVDASPTAVEPQPSAVGPSAPAVSEIPGSGVAIVGGAGAGTTLRPQPATAPVRPDAPVLDLETQSAPDSAAALQVPEDLYLDPMAVPPDGPTPVAASPSKSKQPEAKSSEGKGKPAAEKSSNSKDESGKKKSGDSNSKSSDKPAKKEGDSSKQAAPDSTKGKETP